jgi:predicted nuclease with TOPRIM domain
MSKENITFFFKDKDEDTKNKNLTLDFDDLIKEFDLINPNEISLIDTNKFTVNNKNNSLESHSVSELQKICEYYDLLKNVKLAKYKKIEIINAIKLFESDDFNKNVVDKRKRLWGFMNELMSDKIMKKYIIWK